MSGSGELWLALVLMGLTTLGTRGCFILLGERARLPPAWQQALRYAPAAALAALVVPDLLVAEGEVSLSNPQLFAGIAVAVVAVRSRNPWLPFIVGMGVLLLLRKGLSW